MLFAGCARDMCQGLHGPPFGEERQYIVWLCKFARERIERQSQHVVADTGQRHS
jgi:hypothetical protein